MTAVDAAAERVSDLVGLMRISFVGRAKSGEVSPMSPPCAPPAAMSTGRRARIFLVYCGGYIYGVRTRPRRATYRAEAQPGILVGHAQGPGARLVHHIPRGRRSRARRLRRVRFRRLVFRFRR